MITYGYFIAAGLLSLAAYFSRSKAIQVLLSGLFLVLQISFNIAMYLGYNDDTSGYIHVDEASLIFLSILSIISVTTVINSFVYLNHRHERSNYRAYYFSSLFAFVACITGVYVANNIGLLWILVEATTLSLAIMIYHEKVTESLEAVWKYVFVSTIGLSFALIGILLLDVAIKGASFNAFTFTALMNTPINIEHKLLFQIAFLLIIIGFSVKMEMFPLHTVCVDAVAVAPSPISAMLPSVLLNAGFLAFFRFYAVFIKTPLASWINNVVFILGGLSILIAATYMIKVKNYKRLLAYSGIEHIGIVMIGIAAGGFARNVAFLHLIIHSFAKAGLFYQAGQFIRIYKSRNIIDTGGYFNINPFGGVLVIASVLLILGFPPSGLFYTELMIFKTLVDAKLFFIVIPMLILLCFIIWIFSKDILKILFAKPLKEIKQENIKISAWENIPQLFLIVGAIYLGINTPEWLWDWINNIVNTLVVLK